MAGNLAFFVGLLAFSAGLEINSRECQPSGKTLNCRWRGKGNYVVSTPLYQEILTMNYMSIAASLIVPPLMKGSLMKIEIKDGDISCSAIIAPHTILVYITKQRCEVSTSTPANTQTSAYTPTGTQTSAFTPTRTQTSASTPTGTQTSASAPTGTQTSAFTPTRTQTSASTPIGTRETNEDTTPWQVLVYIFGVVIVILLLMAIYTIYRRKRTLHTMCSNCCPCGSNVLFDREDLFNL